MAVRRPRPRPQTSVTPGGPFAEETLALDLVVEIGQAAQGPGQGQGQGQGDEAAAASATQQQQLVPLEVTWLRRRGERVRKDQELATVRCRLGREEGGPEVVRKLLAPRTGTLEEALTPTLPLTGGEGESEDGASPPPPSPPARLVLGRVVYCTHPCLRDDRMCAVCGEVAPDLGQAHHGEGGTTRVFVQGGHHVSVSKTEAASLYRSMAQQLQRARKLHLVLDIDLTLLHATIDPRAQELPVPEGAEVEVHSFEVMSFGRPLRHWCCLRPGLRRFLEEAKALYVLSIYTHGRRDYAHQVARLLDPARALFGDRIVSRDDCPDLQGQKSLQRLFPGGIEMALILDDSPQVWQGEQSRHLLPVLPFKYYTEFEELNRVQGLAPATASALKAFGDPKDDTQLEHTWRVLQEIHALYYPPQAQGQDQDQDQADLKAEAEAEAATARPMNVAGCLSSVRKRCLSGCSVVFSGLVPRGLDPRRTDLGYMATALGAAVTEALSEATTHVVAENPSTEKVYHARQRADRVHIVTRAWLQLSFWHCERKPEADFPLPQLAKPKQPAPAPAPAPAAPAAPVPSGAPTPVPEAAAASAGASAASAAATGAEMDEGDGGEARAAKRVKVSEGEASASASSAMEEGSGNGNGNGSNAKAGAAEAELGPPPMEQGEEAAAAAAEEEGSDDLEGALMDALG